MTHILQRIRTEILKFTNKKSAPERNNSTPVEEEITMEEYDKFIVETERQGGSSTKEIVEALINNYINKRIVGAPLENDEDMMLIQGTHCSNPNSFSILRQIFIMENEDTEFDGVAQQIGIEFMFDENIKLIDYENVTWINTVKEAREFMSALVSNNKNTFLSVKPAETKVRAGLVG